MVRVDIGVGAGIGIDMGMGIGMGIGMGTCLVQGYLKGSGRPGKSSIPYTPFPNPHELGVNSRWSSCHWYRRTLLCCPHAPPRSCP